MDDGLRRSCSEAICEKLEEVETLKNAARIACFYPFGREPDIRPFLWAAFDRGKKLCFPRSRNREGAYHMAEASSRDGGFTSGNYGILEPRESEPVVASVKLSGIPWLVPGIAFDLRGNRIGRGNGVYDRFLEGVEGEKIGICFKNQIAGEIPSEAHDRKMDILVSEDGVRQCKNYKEEISL